MLPNEVINSISPIDSAWQGSSLIIPLPDTVVETSGVFGDNAVGVFTLSILVIFLLFGKRIITTVPQLFNLIFYSRDYKKMSDYNNLFHVLNLIFFMCGVIFIAEGERYGFFKSDYFIHLSPSKNYLIALSILISIFLLKSVLLRITGSVTRKKNMFISVIKASLFFFCTGAFISLIPLPFTYLNSSPDLYAFRIVVCSLLGVIFLLYLFYVVKIFISSGVSRFFCFLYLCTLEILPVSLIVGTLVKI